MIRREILKRVCAISIAVICLMYRHPHATETQLAIKVIDTDSGAISVSAVVSGKNYITGNASKNVDLIETLINEIKIRTRIGQRN